MRDLEFSRADIEKLAEKLSGAKLDAGDRELLLAIFAAAAARTKPVGKGKAIIREAEINERPYTKKKVVRPESLREQLVNAYAPGNDFEIVTSKKIVKKPVG